MQIKLLGGLTPLTPRSALRDAVAGVILALMNVPQVLGYTRIAGTPVVTGLYTVLLPLIGFAFFGSSRHLVVAADSATAAIFSSALSSMAQPASPRYIALVGVLTLQTALLLLLARVLKLGFLADFLSRTALVGFLTGVGIQVCVAMVPDMLGVAVSSHRTLSHLQDVLQGLPHLNSFDLVLSAGVVIAILLGRWLVPGFPVPLVVAIGLIAASSYFDFAGRGLAIIGTVPGGLPALRWPEVSWEDALALLRVAGSCFVVILAQSSATGRVYALKYGERVDENADILGLAAANVGAAISGAFVVNGSPTQTAMAENAGARSQFAQLTFAAIVVVLLLTSIGPLQYLPHSVLASIVFTIAVGMVDVQGMKAILAESPGEFRLALLTAAAVPCVGVEQGIVLAIILSLVRHVRHSYRPHSSILVPGVSGRWEPIPARIGLETAPGLIVYRFGADLFYANVDGFADEARALITAAPSRVHHFVIDAGALTDIDFSAARTFRDLVAQLKKQRVDIVIGRVSAELHNDLERHGVATTLGPGKIFRTMHEALEATKSATD